MSHALIKRIHDAVKSNHIEQPFTAHDIEIWIVEKDIRKEDGTKYKAGYPATLLSTSYIRKVMKRNRNSVWLDRCFNKIKCMHEYWFVEP